MSDLAKHLQQPPHQKEPRELKGEMLLFKVACYFDPCKVLELKSNCCDLDFLRALPCLDEDCLKSELPQYMAKAADVDSTISKIDWWSNHKSELPNWSKVSKLSLLFQSSLAAAKEFFPYYKTPSMILFLGRLH